MPPGATTRPNLSPPHRPQPPSTESSNPYTLAAHAQCMQYKQIQRRAPHIRNVIPLNRSLHARCRASTRGNRTVVSGKLSQGARQPPGAQGTEQEEPCVWFTRFVFGGPGWTGCNCKRVVRPEHIPGGSTQETAPACHTYCNTRPSHTSHDSPSRLRLLQSACVHY